MICQRLLTPLAGLRTGGRVTFTETAKRFSFAKKACFARGAHSLSAAKLREHQKEPKEIAPTIRVPALRFGQPAVLGLGGVWLNSPSAQTTPALIRRSLRSSARLEGGERGPDTGRVAALATVTARCASPGVLLPLPHAGEGWGEGRNRKSGSPSRPIHRLLPSAAKAVS